MSQSVVRYTEPFYASSIFTLGFSPPSVLTITHYLTVRACITRLAGTGIGWPSGLADTQVKAGRGLTEVQFHLTVAAGKPRGTGTLETWIVADGKPRGTGTLETWIVAAGKPRGTGTLETWTVAAGKPRGTGTLETWTVAAGKPKGTGTLEPD